MAETLKLVVSAVVGSLLTALITHWTISKHSENGAIAKATVSDERKTPLAISEATALPSHRRSLIHEQRSAPEARGGSVAPRGDSVPHTDQQNPRPERVPARSSSTISGEGYPEFLDFSFAQEAVDIVWAKETESKIHAALTKLPDIRVARAECKSTMCRFEVAYDSVAAAQTFEIDYFQVEPFSNTSAFLQPVKGPDGLRKGLVVLFARKGHPLPQIAEPAPAD